MTVRKDANDMTLRLRPDESSRARPARHPIFSAALSALIVILLALSAPLTLAQTRPTMQWIRGGHTKLNQLVISADGNYMATCGDEGTFKLHRLSDGVVTVTGSGHTG